MAWLFFLSWLFFQLPTWPQGGFPGGTVGKESSCQCRRHKRHGFDPWIRKIPWRRKWQSTLVFLPIKFQWQRSPVGYSPLGHKESDTTEWLTVFSKLGKLIIWLFLRSFSGIRVSNHSPILNLLNTYHRPNTVLGSGDDNSEQEKPSPYPWR